MSRLLEQLRKHKEDRGLMADLRCALVAGKRHRAWPALNRLNVKVTDEVAAIIAGLYATHPEETFKGNFGTTCKAIQTKRDQSGYKDKETKLTPTERRFQHVLAAEKGEELHQRATRLVLLAKSEGVPVNYAQLETDLKYWTDRTRTEWAATFWTPDVKSSSEVEEA